MCFTIYVLYCLCVIWCLFYTVYVCYTMYVCYTVCVILFVCYTVCVLYCMCLILCMFYTADVAVKPSYSKVMEAKFDAMLEGDLEKLPPLPRSIVKIFVSSTFSGTSYIIVAGT